MRGEKRQRARCEKYLTEWSQLLGLDKWLTLHARYTTEPDERKVAEITADWEYRQGTITFYLPKVAVQTDAVVSSVVLHELLHLLVAPMAVKLKHRDADREEFVVESLCIAIDHMAEALGREAQIDV